jgi:hypothetical protein
VVYYGEWVKTRWVKTGPVLKGAVPVNAKMANATVEPKSEYYYILRHQNRYTIEKVEDRDRIRYVKNTLLKGLAKQLAPRTSKEV